MASPNTTTDTLKNEGRVIFWGVPRCRSTVFLKCLSAIEDSSVWFRPYDFAARISDMYYQSTGRTLPLEYKGNEELFKEASRIAKERIGQELYPEKLGFADVKYRLQADTSKFVITKDQAYAMHSPQAYVHLPSGFKHCFLIRDPSRVFLSIRKAMLKDLKQAGVDKPDESVSITKDDPLGRPLAIIYPKQHELWRYIRENVDPNPVVIDSDDLASNPRVLLQKFCSRVGLPYSDSLLSWEKGGLEALRWETAGKFNSAHMEIFYASAFNSTHFTSPKEQGPIPRDQLTDDVLKCVDISMPYYKEMYANRLT